MLFPKKTKYSKSFSGKKLTPKVSAICRTNKYGNVLLVAAESGKVTNFQLEALRRFLRRFLKKKAQIFFRVFPSVPVTKKPNDVRLGRGKGNLKYWALYLKKGAVLLEIRSFDDALTNKVVHAAKIKLSIKTITSNRQTRWIL